MSATEVGGVAVVSDEPTVAPIQTKGGAPVLWEQTRTLTLADGNVVYGCKHCDFVRANPNAIRPHLNRHKPRTPKAASNGHAPTDMSLADLIAKVSDLDTITADRDEWKRRALAAEKDLRTIRRVMGAAGTGGAR